MSLPPFATFPSANGSTGFVLAFPITTRQVSPTLHSASLPMANLKTVQTVRSPASPRSCSEHTGPLMTMRRRWFSLSVTGAHSIGECARMYQCRAYSSPKEKRHEHGGLWYYRFWNGDRVGVLICLGQEHLHWWVISPGRSNARIAGLPLRLFSDAICRTNHHAMCVCSS